MTNLTRVSICAQANKYDELIDSELILRTAEKHGASDQRERSMTTLAFFWTLVLSVEDKMYHGFYASMKSAFHKLTGRSILKQSISEQMQRRDWHWLKDIYDCLLAQYWDRLDGIDKEYLEQFDDFRAVDATVIYVVKTLRQRFRATTRGLAALKINTTYSLRKFVPLKLEITAETLHEVSFNFLTREKNVLYVFDLGWWCYGLFERIMERKCFFVCRLRNGADVTIKEFRCKGYSAFSGRRRLSLKELIDCNSLCGDRFDAMVKLGDMRKRLRLVGLRHDDDWYFYVTNITDEKLTPQRLYEIYRYRWQIEIFFKELKSNVSLRHIVTKDENAIMLEIYATLIFYLLTRTLMSEASKGLSVRKCLAEVKRRLANVVIPMLLGRARIFRSELKGLLQYLAAHCKPG
jgi:hypothetical protein